MQNLAPLSTILKKIRGRTLEYEELRSAHHFLFALPRNAENAERIKIAIIGINPGESRSDWSSAPKSGQEESFEIDFHSVAASRAPASKRWLGHVDYFTDMAPSILTEMFFWSSKNLDAFKVRFGELSKSPHLDFCKECNLELFNRLMPDVIIGPGLGMLNVAKEVFALTKLRHPFRCDVTGHRLVEEYTDGVRPWLFTKHWSGSRAFTNFQKEAIRDRIKGVMGRA